MSRTFSRTTAKRKDGKVVKLKRYAVDVESCDDDDDAIELLDEAFSVAIFLDENDLGKKGFTTVDFEKMWECIKSKQIGRAEGLDECFKLLCKIYTMDSWSRPHLVQ